MTSPFKSLSSLLLAVLLFGNAAHATFKSDSKEALRNAISNIKNNTNVSGRIMKAGRASTYAGVVAIGVPMALMSVKILPRVAGRWAIWLGTKIIVAGITTNAIGAVVAVFEPVAAHGSYLTDYFLTPAGFKEFLEGTPDQMEAYADMDPRLAELVLQMSVGVDAMKAQN